MDSPDLHPSYEQFFSRHWIDSLMLSLHNFINSVFQHIPLPTLLSLHEEHHKVKSLTSELDYLKGQLKHVHTLPYDPPPPFDDDVKDLKDGKLSRNPSVSGQVPHGVFQRQSSNQPDTQPAPDAQSIDERSVRMYVW